jgi:cold shock CspA family protein
VSHGSEKGANISLALEAYEQMVHIGFDVVVLVACDGDYVPLVRKLNSLGARVMVIGWEYSYEDDNGGHRQTMTSGRLMAEATYGIWMQDVINKQLYSQDKIDALFVSGGPGAGYSGSEGAQEEEEDYEDYEEGDGVTPERRLGTVVQLKSGYGFITPEKGDHDFFFLWEDLDNCEFDDLRIGEKVEFEVGTNDRGECARKVLWLDPDGIPYVAPSAPENEEKQNDGNDQSF